MSDNTPEPIEPIHYSAPRAVAVRVPTTTPSGANDIGHHSAIHGDINVFVDSLTDGQKIIDGWSEIIQAASLKALEILGRE